MKGEIFIVTRDGLIQRFKDLSAEEAAILTELNSVRQMIVQMDSGFLKVETETENKIPEMLTIKKASERTGLSYSTIRDLCKRDKITYIMTGKKYLVNMGKLAEYLNGQVN